MKGISYISGRNYSLTALFLLLIAAIYTLLSLWTPPAFDDWIFMAGWREVNGDKSPSLSTLLEFWKYIREYDNGRLANTFSPLSTMFSPWKELFPVMTGLCMACMVVGVSWLSFSKNSLRPWNLAIVCVTMIFLLPWRNSLFVADYALNYVWATVVTLVFMIYVVANEKRGWNTLTLLGALFLAFLAGGWHEGFALATLGGFLLYTIVKGGRFSIQWYATGVFYAVVMTGFYLCPGLLARTEKELGVTSEGLNLIKLSVDLFPVALLVFLVVLFNLAPSLRALLRKAWSNEWFVIALGIVVVGSLLSLLFAHQPRSAFWPDLMAIVMIFILTRPFWERLEFSAFGAYTGFLAFAVFCAVMVYALVWQRQFYSEAGEIIAEMEKSETGTVFYDITPPDSMPVTTLKIPVQNAWVTAFQFHALKQHTGKEFPAVVPVSVKETADKAVPLKGSDGIFSTGNALFMKKGAFPEPKTVAVDVTLNDGATVEAMALVLPFISADNQRWVYINVYGINVEDIESLSFS